MRLCYVRVHYYNNNKTNPWGVERFVGTYDYEIHHAQ